MNLNQSKLDDNTAYRILPKNRNLLKYRYRNKMGKSKALRAAGEGEGGVTVAEYISTRISTEKVANDLQRRFSTRTPEGPRHRKVSEYPNNF